MIINNIIKGKNRRNTIFFTVGDIEDNYIIYSDETIPSDFVTFNYKNTDETIYQTKFDYYFNNILLETYVRSGNAINFEPITRAIDITEADLDTIGMLVVQATDFSLTSEDHTKKLNYINILYGFDFMKNVTLTDNLTGDGFVISEYNNAIATDPFVPDRYLILDDPADRRTNNPVKPIKEIADRAFYAKTSLVSITLPHSIEKIGVGAFRLSENLSSITILAENPPQLMGAGTFFGTEFNLRIYVPQQSLDIYRTDPM
jgi:hypothetical protein